MGSTPETRCRAISRTGAPPELGAATEAGGHAAQVDRAPFGEQGAHGIEVTSRPAAARAERPDPEINGEIRRPGQAFLMFWRSAA